MEPSEDYIVLADDNLLEDAAFKREIGVPYFKDIYKDLLHQVGEKSKAIDKNTLVGYSKLPGILGERLFSVLDLSKNDHVDLREFVFGFFKIFYSTLETKMKVCFDM
jgi:hypothetical protein